MSDAKQSKRGRPALDPPAVEVCLTLPAPRYDDLYARAKVERVSVPELIRRELERLRNSS